MVANGPKIEAAMQASFFENHMKVGPGQYLVAAKGTAIDVSNLLGISDGSNGSGIVLATSAYYGRAENNIWEWMKLKISTP